MQCRGFGLRPLTTDIAESLGSMYVTFVHDEFAYPPGTSPPQFGEGEGQSHGGEQEDGRMHASESDEAEYVNFLGLLGLSRSRTSLPASANDPDFLRAEEATGRGIDTKPPARFDHLGRAISAKMRDISVGSQAGRE